MGTIKMFVGIFAIVAAVYLCAALMPPFFSNYQFQDDIKNEAVMATYSTKPTDEIRDTIFKKAQDLNIPISRDAIKVIRTGPQNAGSVTIHAPYTVHVDLPGYPMDLHFNPSTQNRSAF
jgi:hypothetical protein